jgi:hypothetical protein
MSIALYNQFKKNQTLSNLEKLKNKGIILYELNFSNWQELHEYALPFKNMVPLYINENGRFKFYAIGIY